MIPTKPMNTRSKGILGDTLGLVIGGALIAIVVGLMATVLVQVQTTQTSGSVAFNASAQGLSGLGQFATFLPVIFVVIATVVIVTLILAVRKFTGGGL